MHWILLSALAQATQPAVLGQSEARSVVLVLAPSLEERSVRCDDLDGDGVWSCPAGELPPRLEALGLLVDGATLVQSLDVALGQAPEAVVLEQVGQGLRVSTSPLAPREGGAGSRPGAAVLMAEVRVPGEAAPRLAVTSARGTEELACEDGGRFPDLVANDGARTCAGLVPDGAVELTLRLPGQPPRRLGELTWPPEIGLRQVRVDERGASVASWPVLDRAKAAPRREDAPRVSPPNNPMEPGQGKPIDAPGGLGVGLATLSAAGLLALGWRVGRGRPRPIPHARPLPPPPVVPGAPAGSAIFRVPAGQAEQALGWLVGRLAATRPVLVVGEGVGVGGPGVVLASTSPDVDDVAEAVRAIARRAIAPPAVVARAGLLSWAGGVGQTPESALLAALPPGAILALVLTGEPAPAALPEVTLTSLEGQWRVR